MKIRKSMENIAGTIDRYDYYRDCVEYADPLFGVGCATSAGQRALRVQAYSLTDTRRRRTPLCNGR